MIYTPTPSFLEHLHEQGIEGTQFDIDDGLFRSTLNSFREQHKAETESELENRTAYYLIWQRYGVPDPGKSAKGSASVDVVNAKRLVAVHEIARRVQKEQLPEIHKVLSEANGKSDEIIGALNAIAAGNTTIHESLESFRADTNARQEKHEAGVLAFASTVDSIVAGAKKAFWLLVALLVGLIVLTAFSVKAHAQVDCVKWQDSSDVTVGNFCAPFKVKAGSNVTFSKSGTVLTITAAGGGVGSTNALLDGSNHTDTLAGSVTRGDVIIGNSTPKWSRLAIGTAGKYIKSDGTDASWQLIPSTVLSDFSSTAPSSSGKIPIWDSAATNSQGGAGAYVPGDPLVQGLTAHDAAGTSTNPVAVGGFASAAAPTDVSTDGDIVRAWYHKNGAQVVDLNAALPAGSNVIGHVIADTGSTTAVTGNVAITAASLPAPLSVTATGNITNTQAITVSTAGAQTVVMNVSGTWTGTIQPQISVDGTTFSSVGVIPFAPTGASVSTITANGNYFIVVGGSSKFQLLGNTVASGTAVITEAASPAGFAQLAVQSTAANLNATVVQATGTNLHTVLDTTSTTAVTQATGTNLHAVLDTTSTTAVTQATGSNLHAVLDANSGVDIGKLTANQSTNMAQIAGTASSVNSGTKDAGTLRVVLATDQPALTNKLLVTPDSVALPANQSVNVAQMNGVATTMGAGATGTGVQRVNDVASSATAAAVPASAIYAGGTDGTNLLGFFVDPCAGLAKTYTPVSMSTATTTRFAAPAASKKTYICSIVLVAAGADNVNIIEGTGGTCGTATAGVAGGTTAATGFNLAANGGLTLGNGASSVMATAGSNVDMCLITSAATQLSGHIAWVQR